MFLEFQTVNMHSTKIAILCSIALTWMENAIAINTETFNQEFDFIVVGGGTAGSAVASRLSEDGKHDVLLLEAGGEPQVFNDIPYFAPGPFDGEMDWKFVTVPQKHACLALKDQKCHWPRGKGLGGSTLINALYFTRGDRKDYDRWEELGNEGWGYEDVLPYFIKMEDYSGPITKENEKYHGRGGPVSVGSPTYKTEIHEVMLEAGKELGYPIVDYNAGSQRGFSNPVFILRNGSRHTMYKAYLEKARTRPNLRIVTDALVTKVQFDEKKKAVGVMFERDGQTVVAKASKEIILSGGTASTPQILLLSGVGPKDTLQKFQIPIVKDLPGVGQNLKDHVGTMSTIMALQQQVGFNFETDVTAENLELWEKKGEGPLSVPLRFEAMAFVDSEYVNASDNWPDLEFVFQQPPGLNIAVEEGLEFTVSLSAAKSYIIGIPVLLRPKSVGYMTITSKNPRDPPLFQPNYLTDEDDVNTLMSGIKIFQQIINTKAFQKYGASMAHSTPAKVCKQHQFMSDEYLKCVIHHYSGPIFHPCGTCRMGPTSDESAVVNSKLKVYGVKGLRVADMSITPSIPSAHTMAPAIMIGEKAAAMILEEWNRKQN